MAIYYCLYKFNKKYTTKIIQLLQITEIKITGIVIKKISKLKSSHVNFLDKYFNII